MVGKILQIGPLNILDSRIYMICPYFAYIICGFEHVEFHDIEDV